MPRSLASLIGEARAHTRAALAALVARRVPTAIRIAQAASDCVRWALRRRLDVRLALVAARSTRLARERATRPRRAPVMRARRRPSDPSVGDVDAVLVGLLAFGAFQRRGVVSLRALERILTP